MALPGLIEANAAQLDRMHRAIREAWRHRLESPAHKREWHDACLRFHESYDGLAFPGGLERGMALLKQHDASTIEVATRFLEVDPWFNRSGYIKADLIRWLRQAPLSGHQRERLRAVILARIQGRDAREFRWYCRLARFLASPQFLEQVRALAASPDPRIARHASWVLAQLRASRDSRR